MTPLSKDQLQALRTLRSVWPREGLALIGASALDCVMRTSWRVTYDLDLCLSVSAAEYEPRMESLPGWKRGVRMEHRWIAPGVVSIGVLPASPELSQAFYSGPSSVPTRSRSR